MSSPKRKSSYSDPADHEPAKKPRPATTSSTDSDSAETTPPSPTAPDSLINSHTALAYWSATSPTVSGILGGYPQVSRVDLQGSRNFLAKLRRASSHHPPGRKLRRAVDCGAGIGRITEGLLTRVAEVVDIVEPVFGFTEALRGKPGVGEIWNLGLEAWFPEREAGVGGRYDLVWNQWCLGQLTDAQLVAYLRRLPKVLSEGGWIVVKENMSNHVLGQDVFDEEDSSVTRTDAKFRRLFVEEAGLKLVSTELQKGMPKDLYPVRTYALQPR
ncbi:hypothetical protein LTR91_019196 [Friedmanniomyces endolithicus]|uniref:Alpha N-terminal protein methyltransferase 1 n=1 Tax=Friedmanniomyces endolithicus TaxID=329885 RepID=A0AAN6HB28_9PEZI|nr:hypothetical protein LTS00_014956 [Friedmanniomyces endolithicus]KAK0281565.1 hypothetical protein LTR35_007244 [Friedmanniomyces endolithicus]KAK0315418.1 hypothetical protein LTR01_000716 [Friedmanniomyces endolithicus]KAK0827087.1 hypothetical protein LTR73_005870 [Friedmanniomyces endolithicus]KAK0920606.1 hypothetical protein LTR57_009656 [Friedmanniomyces endolithicus]